MGEHTDANLGNSSARRTEVANRLRSRSRPDSARRRSKTRRLILFAALGLVILVIAVLLYRHFAAWESTDDAQIDGYIYPVSSRVSGYVTRVAVDDNQYVEGWHSAGAARPQRLRGSCSECQSHFGE